MSDAEIIERLKIMREHQSWGTRESGIEQLTEGEAAALREIERLRAALDFYGTVENYFSREEKTAFGTYTHHPAVHLDGGKKARDILKKFK